MELGLKDRVAIDTAASSGLGKATAQEVAAEGANLLISARGEEQLRSAADEIRAATGVDVVPVPGDVTDESHARELVAEARGRFGRLDILITNAGGPPAGFFNDFTAAHYRDALELNLVSTINLCREAVPLMRERGWGRIVAITSIAAKQPIENLILSNTARAGVLGFMKSLSQQVAADDITVNTVCPGYHLTERLKSMSERASYVTGTVIQIDGGAYKALY
jgi:3-oxoacyl-[acyl-carrier protein] reductase